LADLSHNIVQGNSLVADRNVHLKALDWKETFPVVFNRQEGGFDCVIGNPPWERLKLQEREFFAFSAPNIANAVSAARRRQLIAELRNSNPELFARYTAAKETADRTLSHVRSSGEYPLTARGDINTYMLFAELARKLIAPSGRAGLLVPSGIATDNTPRDFFNTLMDPRSLIKLYDFENRQRIFPTWMAASNSASWCSAARMCRRRTPISSSSPIPWRTSNRRTVTSPCPAMISLCSIPTRAPARFSAAAAMPN
jgi:hypothetical protein